MILHEIEMNKGYSVSIPFAALDWTVSYLRLPVLLNLMMKKAKTTPNEVRMYCELSPREWEVLIHTYPIVESYGDPIDRIIENTDKDTRERHRLANKLYKFTRHFDVSREFIFGCLDHTVLVKVRGLTGRSFLHGSDQDEDYDDEI